MSKYTTIAQIKADIKISYAKILDFYSELQADAHGMAYLIVEMKDNTTLAELEALYFTPAVITDMEGKNIYSGICVSVAIENQDGYQKLILELSDLEVAADMSHKTHTFQSPGKKLSDILDEVLQEYGCNVQLEQNPAIPTVVYQQNETDWQFACRMINSFGMHMYSCCRGTHMAITGGTKGGRAFDNKILEKQKSRSRNVNELRAVQANEDRTAVSYQFESCEYTTDELTVMAGDTVGNFTVVQSRIVNENGNFVNHIQLARSMDAKASYAASVSADCVSNIVTGTVLSVTGNIVQVQFDADAADMSGNCVDIPYESALSNSFYCMPDIGDKVFVYYENNGKIVCLGSSRSNTDGPDYSKPDEKVLTNKDKMIRFTSSSLIVTDTRKKYDEEDDTEISIKFEDEGITITSGSDVSMETTEEGSMLLAAISSPKKLEDAKTKVETGKGKYSSAAEENNSLYLAEGGMSKQEQSDAAGAEEFDRFKKDLKQNFEDTKKSFMFNNIVQTAKGEQFSNGEKGENGEGEEQKEIAEDDVSYDNGVVTIYGLNEITFSVKDSSIIINTNIFISAKNFGWMGYEKGEHDIVEEEYQDWWSTGLDVLQMGLDLCGFIPGIGVFFDLANAAVSLARGDYCGAAMSAIAAIPGLGDGIAAAKMGVKAFKAAATTEKVLTKGQKTWKILKMIYMGGRLIDSGLGVSKDIKEAISDENFDWSNPNDIARAIGIVRQFIGMAGNTKDIYEGGKAVKKGKEYVLPSEKNKSKSKESGKKSNSDGNEASSQHPHSKGGDGDENSSQHPHSKGGDGGEASSQHPHSEGGDGSENHPRENNGDNHPACDADATHDPINLATGSLMAEYVDLGVEDTLGLYSLKRYYESAYKNTGGILGDMWRFGIESTVSQRGEFADVQMEDLHMEHFRRIDGRWVNQKDGSEKFHLVDTMDGYRLTVTTEGKHYEYDKTGRLMMVADIHDNRTTLAYTGNLLTQMTFSSGTWIRFFYENGRLSHLEDNTGRRVSYHYEGNFLTSVRLPNGGTMYYSYTPEGYLTRLTDLNGKCFSTNYYDRRGRVIRQELEGGEEYVAFYDDANRQNTFLTTSTGENVTYTYDQNKKITEILHPDGTKETRVYDAAGNRVEENDRYGRKTKRTYGQHGELLSETDPAGLMRQYTYNEAGQVIHYKENTGRELINTYDEKNNLSSTSVRLDANTWRKTEYKHDHRGRLLQVIHADQSVERYSYKTEFGTPTSYTAADGATTYYRYDPKGSLIAVEDAFGTVWYGKNHMGHITSIRDEEGNVTRYYYDNMANITKYIRPNGYNPKTDDGKGIEYRYDAWTHLSKMVSPEREVTRYENDYLGNRLREIRPNEAGKETPAAYVYNYDKEKHLLCVTAPDGGVTYTERDLYGNVLQSMTPEEYRSFQKDEEENTGKGILLRKTKKPGYHYQYDCMNRLVKVTDTDGVVEAAFVYDRAGFLVKEMNAADYLSADTDEERTGTYYTYDYEGNVCSIRKTLRKEENGRVCYSLVTFGYDVMGRCIFQKRYLDEQDRHSAKGRVNRISYAYDRGGRLCRVTDSTGAVSEYTYNSRGQRTVVRNKIREDVWQETGYTYSPCGNIIKVAVSADENGCGRKYAFTTYTYDGNGNITGIQLPSGDEIHREYDLCDRITAEHYREKNGSIDNRITYHYDMNGNLTEVRYQDGYTITMRYDVMDRLVSRTEGRGTTRMTYDLDGKLISQINPNELQARGDAAKGFRYYYDSKGRNTGILSPEDQMVYKAVYDRAGNPVVEGNGDGTVEIAYDLAGRRTEITSSGKVLQRYQYDAMGNLTGLTDGNGNETAYATDLWGRVETVTLADGTMEHYSYDHAGNVCAATDGNGNTVRYVYNRANQLAERHDAAGSIEKFTYDILGRLQGHCDRDGRQVHYAYNMLGSPTEISSGREHMADYSYDAMGRLSSALGGGMRYDYRYYEGGLLKEKRASGRILTSYTYDAEGNKVGQKDLTGKETGYRYDFSGRLTAVTDMGQCNQDRLHFADADASGRILAEYVYSASGNPVVKKIGGNITSTYAYDELLNIKALKTETEKQILADNHYFYDGNGNQIRREGLEGTTGYAYDGRNRLTEISYPSALGGYTEKLGYDAAGNRIRRETEQEITTYRYDNCNRLQELHREYKNAETSTAQPQIIRYTYDRQGNMLSEGEKKYSYDSFGRMVRAEVPVEHRGASNKPDEHAGFNHAAQSAGETFGTQEISSATREFQVQINRYDGEGLRHEMEENGHLIKFLYNEDREVVAEETSNGTITRYIRGLGIISSDSEEAKTYYHYVSDEQGSITHVLSEDAEILNHYSYDAFGNIIEKTEKVENRFCYNGEMLDPVTQQYYLRARFYNPVIGRFTQEDTYYGDGLNLYQYCQANPVGYVDPSGHNCGTTQSRYNSDEEQHPKANTAGSYQSATEKGKANAAGGYTSATEKGNSKSGRNSTDTPINSGVSKPRDVATPNSIYEQMNPDGTVKSRAFYDENGNQFSRQDFDHRHFDKKTKQYYQPHEHNYSYNENGQPTGKSDGPLSKGYSNKPTN